jgi:AGCS family alanine or glycine:cation symporter
MLIPSIIFATTPAASTNQNQVLENLYQILFSILNFSIGGIPLIVLWLIAGATFFTVRMKFINFRAFRHAIQVVMGKYDDPEETGEVTHFQALSAALAGTVGLGKLYVSSAKRRVRYYQKLSK